MTRDDIIRMTREAGLDQWDGTSNHFASIMERFAALVAAAEREACAEVCERLPETFKIAADEFGYTAEQPTAENYAAAIRARSDE
jgi:sugar-specific transcriptional regulator TrmB